jgi:hypothetical protein
MVKAAKNHIANGFTLIPIIGLLGKSGKYKNRAKNQHQP